MSLDNKVSDSDQVYSSHGVEVIVDGQTLAYLQSATVKYVQEGERSGFLIEQNSPSEAYSGCGTCDSSAGCN